MAKPSNKEANIRSYYGEVNKFGQNGEYDKAIKSLNKSKYKNLRSSIVRLHQHKN